MGAEQHTRIRIKQIPAAAVTRLLIFCLLAGLVLTGCAASQGSSRAGDPAANPERRAARACTLTLAEWLKPPEDPAVDDEPGFGYYYVNEDLSMWASAWWVGEQEQYLRAGEEGVKVGWFRPAGAELEITGRRLDGEAPPLHSHVPCCYPTRFLSHRPDIPQRGVLGSQRQGGRRRVIVRRVGRALR